jgi:hypothetical protein
LIAGSAKDEIDDARPGLHFSLRNQAGHVQRRAPRNSGVGQPEYTVIRELIDLRIIRKKGLRF